VEELLLLAMAPEEDQQGAETMKVMDGAPLIAAATGLKEEGNTLVKKKLFNDAVQRYEKGIEVLDKADGHPILRQEVEQMIRLKAVLFNNVAQCMLSLELWRRANEAATSSLELDETNVKALHRRSKAREALRDYTGALKDAVAQQSLETNNELESRLKVLRAKKEEVDAAIRAEEESSEDEADTELVRMKEKFDEVVEKYDLKDDETASEVADWLASGEWLLTVRRVAQRWKMEEEDAEAFLKWIAKGVEFQSQNSANQAQAAAAAPAPSLMA
jgi:tetratricopeptide (TPR) repeat protein